MILDGNSTDSVSRGRGWNILIGVLLAAVIAAGAMYGWKVFRGRRGQAPASEGAATNAAPELTASDLNDPGRQLIGQCRALRSDGSLAEARSKCYEALAQSGDAVVRAEAESLLGLINIELLFSPAPMPEKEEYSVQAGDSLDRIARKFKTTVDLIAKGNLLKSHVIRPGDRLRVFKGVFAIAVSKAGNDLVLSADGKFIKRYRVGTGQFGKTPAGTFVIVDKIVDPPWWRPDGKVIPFGDKENVLGTRWMSIAAVEGTEHAAGYGIHGTWEDDTIGKQASAGCIRMHNPDVEELFILVPAGTRVTITE